MSNTTATIQQGSQVVARFLKAGDLIERGGVLMLVVGKAIADPANPTERVQIVVEDRECNVGQWYPCSLNRDLWVQLYDEYAA